MSDWIRALPVRFLACKDLGHMWIDGSARIVFRVAVGYTGRGLTCERCSMGRLDVFDAATTELVKRRYFPPDGYQKPEGAETVQRWRFTARRHLLDRAAPTERVPKEWAAAVSNYRHVLSPGPSTPLEVVA